MHFPFSNQPVAVIAFHFAEQIVSVDTRTLGRKHQFLTDSCRIVMPNKDSRADAVFPRLEMRLKYEAAYKFRVIGQPIGRIERMQGPSLEVNGHTGLDHEPEFGAASDGKSWFQRSLGR